MLGGKFETTIDGKGRIKLCPYFLEELKENKKYVLAVRELIKANVTVTHMIGLTGSMPLVAT